MDDHSRQIGELVATDAWADLQPTRFSSCTAPPAPPPAPILEIITELGMIYPPRRDTDREVHAVSVALLAKHCADLPAQHLRVAADEWIKTRPFLPRACELREETLWRVRAAMKGRMIAPPQPHEPPAKPPLPPLTDEEVRQLSPMLLNMAIATGEVTQERADRLRQEQPC